jgi:hypothetical protein
MSGMTILQSPASPRVSAALPSRTAVM